MPTHGHAVEMSIILVMLTLPWSCFMQWVTTALPHAADIVSNPQKQKNPAEYLWSCFRLQCICDAAKNVCTETAVFKCVFVFTEMWYFILVVAGVACLLTSHCVGDDDDAE